MWVADAGLISRAALGQVNQKVTPFQLGRNCSSNRRPNQGLGQFSSSSLPKRCSRSGREPECLVDNLLDPVQGLTRSNKNNGSAMLVRTLLAPVVVQPEAPQCLASATVPQEALSELLQEPSVQEALSQELRTKHSAWAALLTGLTAGGSIFLRLQGAKE